MRSKIKADHIGSFLRPASLLKTRQDRKVSPDQLRAIENEEIKRVLEKQKELGLQIFTEGELCRRNFISDFTDAVEWFDMEDAVSRSWDAS